MAHTPGLMEGEVPLPNLPTGGETQERIILPSLTSDPHGVGSSPHPQHPTYHRLRFVPPVTVLSLLDEIEATGTWCMEEEIDLMTPLMGSISVAAMAAHGETVFTQRLVPHTAETVQEEKNRLPLKRLIPFTQTRKFRSSNHLPITKLAPAPKTERYL